MSRGEGGPRSACGRYRHGVPAQEGQLLVSERLPLFRRHVEPAALARALECQPASGGIFS